MNIRRGIRNMLIPLVRLLVRSPALRKLLRPVMQKNPALKGKLLRMAVPAPVAVSWPEPVVDDIPHTTLPVDEGMIPENGVVAEQGAAIPGTLSPQARIAYAFITGEGHRHS